MLRNFPLWLNFKIKEICRTPMLMFYNKIPLILQYSLLFTTYHLLLIPVIIWCYVKPHRCKILIEKTIVAFFSSVWTEYFVPTELIGLFGFISTNILSLTRFPAESPERRLCTIKRRVRKRDSAAMFVFQQSLLKGKNIGRKNNSFLLLFLSKKSKQKTL